jgi:hypothetical protein
MSVLVHVGTGLSFYFSEIIIRSDVNLITSNQLSDIGEVGEVQPALVHRVQRMEHGWQTEYFKCRVFRFSALNNFAVIQPNTRACNN